MRPAVLPLAFAILFVQAQPALAWDPDQSDPGGDPPPADEWAPEPAPVPVPEGLYLVTETYAGDSIIQSGSVTTYTTETVHEVTGSYARVLESVGTGDASAYDGAAFNGRAALGDGRAVAGTYYENYVRTDYGFVAVSVVFFQDDSARAPDVTLPPTTPVTATPAPVVSPVSVPAVGWVTPIIDVPPPTIPAEPTPAPPPSTVLPDRSIEVLRGRRIALSFAGADVRSWRYVSGDVLALGALSGNAAVPFVGRWDRLAPPGSAWLIRFALSYADGTSHDLVVHVTVRSPGLVE